MHNSRRLLLLACLSAPLAAIASGPEGWPPPHLRDTGLYADWNTRTISPDAIGFSPQYPLWTDGAAKTRWMRLPAGTWIDASSPDVWEFPVGTRLWKEFRFSRRVETRFIEHTADGWQFAAYQWNEDESEATLVPERGALSPVAVRGTIRHAIPSRTDCRSCHDASPSRILGFSALQLSADRDPNAPHAEPLAGDAVTLRGLIARGVVRGLPAHVSAADPRIAARTPTARAALGYLHSNCGNCHTSTGELASLALSLEYPLAPATPDLAPALLTTAARPSKFVPSAWEGPAERLRAGDPDRSVLLMRMASRNPVAQMPPLGTRLVDDEAVALIRKWIAEEPGIQSNRHISREERR